MFGEFLHSDQGLTLVGALTALAWSFFKSNEWRDRARQRRFDQAIQLLESAVEETYRTYVRAIKEARTDGRLLPAEQRRARELAINRAMTMARDQGLDLLREIGAPNINTWIGKLVKRLKARP